MCFDFENSREIQVAGDGNAGKGGLYVSVYVSVALRAGPDKMFLLLSALLLQICKFF